LQITSSELQKLTSDYHQQPNSLGRAAYSMLNRIGISERKKLLLLNFIIKEIKYK